MLEVVDRRIFGIENEYGVTCTFTRAAPAVARTRSPATCSAGWSSLGPQQQRLPAQRRPALPRRRQPPGVRHPRVRRHRRPRRPRQGGGADPRGPARRRRAAPARGGHRRRHLPVQEQHRLGRQLLRLPRELPGRPARRVLPARRRADPVPGHPADHRAAPARCCRPRAARSYCVSQRAEHIWEGVSSATTRSRPIINTRDEPHADAERYRRLHVIVGDSNMSETTTLLKVGHLPTWCCG